MIKHSNRVVSISCKQCKCQFTSTNAINTVKEDTSSIYIKLFYVKNLSIKSTERLAVDAAFVFQIAKCCECKNKVGVYIRLTGKMNGDVVNAVKFDLNAVHVDRQRCVEGNEGDAVDKEMFYNETQLKEDVVDTFRKRVEMTKGNVSVCVQTIKECMKCMNELADKVPRIKEKLLCYVERICERDQNAIANVIEFQKIEKEEGVEGGGGKEKKKEEEKDETEKEKEKEGKDDNEDNDVKDMEKIIPQKFANKNNKVMKKKRNKSKI